MELLGVELVRRLYHKLSGDSEAKVRRIIRYPGVIELQFDTTTWKFRAGQWAFLNCPQLSREEWHSYTITSSPVDPYISIHVPVSSGFGRALEKTDPLPALRINGPYGKPAKGVFNNNISILVGTDAGIFPWMTMLKDLWHRGVSPGNASSHPRPGIEIIWISNMVMFDAFQALLSAMEQQYRSSGTSAARYLRLHIYDTRIIDLDTMHNIVLNSVGFQIDPLTELQTRTLFGKPNFRHLLCSIRDGSNVTGKTGAWWDRRQKVGVYFCGPSSTAEEIGEACDYATSEEVSFKLWKGHP